MRLLGSCWASLRTFASVLVAVTAAGPVVAGCFGDDDDERALPPPPPPPECTVDADCAHEDDGDPCYAPPECDENSKSCYRRFLQDLVECQCQSEYHCEELGYQELGCNVVLCDPQHKCTEAVVPAGPAKDQVDGDCAELRCDGESKEPIDEVDPTDLPDDDNECTVDTCEAGGPTLTPVPTGDACLDGSGVCYTAWCYPGCLPENPDACGTEGANEPNNDFAGSANSLVDVYTCGFLGGDDIDWYVKAVEDDSFESDVLGFSVHSTAPAIELCAYIACHNWASGGIPEGGCGNKIDLGNNTLGCCWTGQPDTLANTWELDCTDTGDDVGTLWVTVRAVDGDGCETYTVVVTDE